MMQHRARHRARHRIHQQKIAKNFDAECVIIGAELSDITIYLKLIK